MARKKARYFDGSKFEDVAVVETNGNLRLIEKEDGSQDYVAPHELDQIETDYDPLDDFNYVGSRHHY